MSVITSYHGHAYQPIFLVLPLTGCDIPKPLLSGSVPYLKFDLLVI